MDFSNISNKSLVGKFLRLFLRIIPPKAILPIIQGRLKGKKWIVGSGNHGCWLGSYEYEKRLLWEKNIKNGDVVYDVGANVGFYTLLSSVLVGPDGHVFSFEPLPRNVAFLREHLRINNVKNVTVTAAAVSDVSGVLLFNNEASPYMGKLDTNGKLEVDAISLDSHILQNNIPSPDYIKIDVEGAEVQVLKGAVKLLRNSLPVVFLAVHSSRLKDECQEILASLGYDFNELSGDPNEILAVPPNKIVVF